MKGKHNFHILKAASTDQIWLFPTVIAVICVVLIYHNVGQMFKHCKWRESIIKTHNDLSEIVQKTCDV